MSDSHSRKSFDFNQAVAQAFMTNGGKSFGLRLWFWLAAFYSVVNLIAFPMMAKHYPALLVLNWQMMQATQAGEIPSDAQNAELLGLFGQMMPAYFILVFGVWFSLIAVEVALHRRNIFGAEHPRIPVRFGPTELKLMLAQLGFCVVLTLIYFVGVLVITLTAVFAAMLSEGIGALLGVIGVFGLIWLLIHWMIRLAPAGAMTIESNKVTVLGAMPIAKGRTGSLFLAYLVVGIGGYVACYLVMGIASSLLVGNVDFITASMGLGDTSPSEVFSALGEKMKNPIFVFIAVISIIAYSTAQALMSLSLSGIASYALKWYRQDNPA